MGIIRHCKSLEQLQLLQMVPMPVPPPATLPSLRQLSYYSSLKALQLPPTSQPEDMLGFEVALLAMTSLEKLCSFWLLWPEQAEVMTTGKMQAPVVEVQAGEVTPVEPLSGEYAMPTLKDLEIPYMTLTQEQETRFGCRLLQQRPLLERLILPELSFVNIDALVRMEWVCLNLTELRLSLDAPHHTASSALTRLSFYRQIGKLIKLEFLHVE
ncbi:hypothetical protein BGX33_001763 [Mortierella sp. NVP41]|nr:hypothetical protein BGX33_001763 [Mortierella sp. NVP41]